MWSRERIILDLKQLAARGEKPDIFQLRAKYNYSLNSKFFPLLEDIRTSGVGLDSFIDGIFERVKDPRDLNFRYGPCNCRRCRGKD